MATPKTAAAKKAARKPASKLPAARKAPVRKPAARKAPAKKATAPGRAAGAVKAGKSAVTGAVTKATGEAFRLAGVGTDAVARATGKAWDQWLAVLDKAGAVAMPHKAIASMLADKYGVPPWWSQMVAVGYEQARGMREMYQGPAGFTANASRTLQASLDRVYGAWSDPALRALWLGNAPVKVTRSEDGKSLRMTWTVGVSTVDVNFYPKGEAKSQVKVQQRKLADRKAVEKQKGFWGGALDRLKALLEKAA
jgi:uncharacterized protein YndB with AHSA1/START domain